MKESWEKTSSLRFEAWWRNIKIVECLCRSGFGIVVYQREPGPRASEARKTGDQEKTPSEYWCWAGFSSKKFNENRKILWNYKILFDWKLLNHSKEKAQDRFEMIFYLATV